MPDVRPRSRLIYALLCGFVIFLGLASRSRHIALPHFIADYAGDTLWALLVFLLIGFLMPRWSTRRVAMLAAGFSLLIEVSQLYHAPWIDAIRRTRIGGLVLGYGFLWSDLACYAVGVACGAFAELLIGWLKERD
ncbi:MAG TPA: DUF2809 domain-containing protein [Blastocatellia bacterium]|nr:DUF2809 domain-containing protein [Blastocatellia bacterium]